MGLPRENIYGLAKLWLSKGKNRVSMEKYDSKQKRIDAKLRRANIIKDLLSTCSNCKVPHTCLDPFRKCPDAVLTWRTHVVPCSLPAFFHLVFFAPFDVPFHFLFTFTSLHFPPLPSNSTSLAPPRLWLSMHRPRTQFYALPKSDRLRRLTLHCYEQYIKSGLDEDEFRMQYKFMGYAVCRRAFVKLTAVDVGTIVQCRKDALATPPRLRPFEKGELPGHIIDGKETDVFQKVGLCFANYPDA